MHPDLVLCFRLLCLDQCDSRLLRPHRFDVTFLRSMILSFLILSRFKLNI